MILCKIKMSTPISQEVINVFDGYGFDKHTDINRVLRIAVEISDLRVIKVLLEHGANVHHDVDFGLRMACYNRRPEIVRLFLDKGANVHAQNENPIKTASKNGCTEVVRLLLDITMLSDCRVRMNIQKLLSCSYIRVTTIPQQMLLRLRISMTGCRNSLFLSDLREQRQWKKWKEDT